MLPRAMIYMDGANLNYTTRSLNMEIDFKRLLAFYSQKYLLSRCAYFTTTDEHEDYQSIRPLLDWLDFNGFQVITKPRLRRTSPDGEVRYRGSINTELALDAYEHAVIGKPDVFILFSGDGALRPLLPPLQRRGITTIVVSSLEKVPDVICSTELRRAADHFVEIMDIASEVGRIRSQRAADPLPEPLPELLPEATFTEGDRKRPTVIRRGAGH